MLKIPYRSEDIRRLNRGRRLNPERHEAYRCLLCEAPVRKGSSRWLHMGNGGGYLVTPEEIAENPNGDLGGFPIGPDCWRGHPEVQEYTR